MLFQEGPAQTTGYMIFGYIVIFGTMALYLYSLAARWRNLKKDEEVLNDMDSEK